MIIKSLEIISFGKFKDKIINLGGGLNVIIGDNESGKSTIMSFVYAMLYGFGDNRGKSATLREKYTPWDGGVCEGKLTLSLTNGEDITIYRKAGSVKKQDTLRVYNALTGQELSSMPEEIIGIGSDTFSKTLCLRQLSTVFCGTNEEIVQKLSNISAGGDENVSFEKAIKILENARREIKPLRGSGGTLSQINTQIADLEKKRAIYLAKHSELEDAQKVLPVMQENVDEAKKIYENELSCDFVSPIAHLQGRIEEKEAQKNNSNNKTSFSRKNVYLLSGILSAILSVTFLPFSLLFIIVAIALIILGIRTKNTSIESDIDIEIQKLKGELSALENNKTLHDAKLKRLKENADNAEEKINSLTLKINSLKMQLLENGEENLDSIYEKKALLEKRLSILSLAINSLNAAHEKMQRNFTPHLNKKASEYFSNITSGKYTKLFSDEQFNLSIDMDIPRKSELFSGGTIDQLYLSLRLALIDMLFGDDTAFLILDQPFLQYDDTRRKKAVEILESLPKNRQIILFTSDKIAFSSNKHTEMLT